MNFKVFFKEAKDLKSLIWAQMYFLTSTPLSRPFWLCHLLLGHAWAFQREHPNPAPLDAQWDSLASRSPCPNPWVVAVAEAGNKKGLLPHLKPAAMTHFISVFLSPLFSFQLQSGSVQIASCPWPGAQTPDRDREHEPRNTPGAGQPRTWSCDFNYGYTWSLDALLVLIQWHI